jgi:2-polyprenyl-6-hydroxyphenyl methylase/3-demethylubiquinone-9 3-methyltransferase
MTAALHEAGSTVDPAEIERFSALAAQWWDADGPFRPLHRLNPTRLRYLRDRLALHFGRDAQKPRPLAGLRVLDLGCGGGLISEPMTRLGAEVVGVDASEKNIGIAQTHADEMGLTIDYRYTTAEELAAKGERFDAVLALEIVEHVADLDSFVTALGALVRPGGATIVTTLNRTPQAFLMAILGAEYVMRWLPRGTHEWKKFVRPSELTAVLRHNDFTMRDLSGLGYSVLTDTWGITDDLTVNYLAFAVKDGSSA